MNKQFLDLDGPFSFGENKYTRLRQLTEDHTIKAILEFGSGRTTARFCQDFDPASVTSVDHSPRFLEETKRLCMDLPKRCQVPDFLHLPLRWQSLHGRLFLSYALSPLPRGIASRQFDLCLIDGPVQSHTLGGREFVLYRIFPCLREGALIILDDSHRSDSQCGLARWQCVFGDNLKTLTSEANMVILQKTASKNPLRSLGGKGWLRHHRALPKVLFKQFRYD